jgi:hypothetical protein
VLRQCAQIAGDDAVSRWQLELLLPADEILLRHGAGQAVALAQGCAQDAGGFLHATIFQAFHHHLVLQILPQLQDGADQCQAGQRCLAQVQVRLWSILMVSNGSVLSRCRLL